MTHKPDDYPSLSPYLTASDADAPVDFMVATFGPESVQEPAQRDDPDRRSGVRDPVGNTWWISTQVG